MARYQLPSAPCARQPQHNVVGLRDVFCPLAHGGTSGYPEQKAAEQALKPRFLWIFIEDVVKHLRKYGDYMENMDDDITRITMFGWFTMALTGT